MRLEPTTLLSRPSALITEVLRDVAQLAGMTYNLTCTRQAHSVHVVVNMLVF